MEMSHDEGNLRDATTTTKPLAGTFLTPKNRFDKGYDRVLAVAAGSGGTMDVDVATTDNNNNNNNGTAVSYQQQQQQQGMMMDMM